MLFYPDKYNYLLSKLITHPSLLSKIFVSSFFVDTLLPTIKSVRQLIVIKLQLARLLLCKDAVDRRDDDDNNKNEKPQLLGRLTEKHVKTMEVAEWQ